jgi:predicted Mrr-cat superfamily restriction endonuclease
MIAQEQQAYILRIAPSEVGHVAEALEQNQLIIGWAGAEGLLDPQLDWESFRKIVSTTCYPNEPNLRRAGAGAGHAWRFIRDMRLGDLVVVPHGANFYVAEITGEAFYDETKKEDDSAYRRPAVWLNGKQPLPRTLARAALISRMKSYGTCTEAKDLVDEIRECLQLAQSGTTPSFKSDLQTGLVHETLRQLRSGRMESYGFERLIEAVLQRMGATTTRILPRRDDKGADIVATFQIAGFFNQIVAIQAKHWQASPPVGKHVVEQLITGLEAEDASLGMVVTSGTIGPDAIERAKQYTEDKGVLIELVDGEQFAKLIVEHGIVRT